MKLQKKMTKYAGANIFKQNEVMIKDMEAMMGGKLMVEK